MKTQSTLCLLALLGTAIAAPVQEHVATGHQARREAIRSFQAPSLNAESSQSSNVVLNNPNSYRVAEDDADDQNDEDENENEIGSRDILVQSAMRRNIAVLTQSGASDVDQSSLLKRQRGGDNGGGNGNGNGRGNGEGNGRGNGNGNGGGGRGRENGDGRGGRGNEDSQN